jgi:hypothetical protein
LTLDPGFRLILPTGLQAAGARIRELRKGVMLGDLTKRELIDEGRP